MVRRNREREQASEDARRTAARRLAVEAKGRLLAYPNTERIVDFDPFLEDMPALRAFRQRVLPADSAHFIEAN